MNLEPASYSAAFRPYEGNIVFYESWPRLSSFPLYCFGTGVLHLIQIIHQPDATIFQFIILTFVYNSTCVGRFPAHHQELNDCTGSLWFYLCIVVIVVLCSWSGRPGGKTPETCWAVNKLQDNKQKNCCIILMIYLNCTMMHGLANLKFYI
jgi:hypothetical protein